MQWLTEAAATIGQPPADFLDDRLQRELRQQQTQGFQNARQDRAAAGAGQALVRAAGLPVGSDITQAAFRFVIRTRHLRMDHERKQLLIFHQPQKFIHPIDEIPFAVGRRFRRVLRP